MGGGCVSFVSFTAKRSESRDPTRARVRGAETKRNRSEGCVVAGVRLVGSPAPSDPPTDLLVAGSSGDVCSCFMNHIGTQMRGCRKVRSYSSGCFLNRLFPHNGVVQKSKLLDVPPVVP